MKPSLSILDESFEYVPATATSVSDTWSRFGWRPMTREERARRRTAAGLPAVQNLAPAWLRRQVLA